MDIAQGFAFADICLLRGGGMPAARLVDFLFITKADGKRETNAERERRG